MVSVGVSAAWALAAATANVNAIMTTPLKRANDARGASDSRRKLEIEKLMTDPFNDVFAWRKRTLQHAPMHAAGKRIAGPEPLTQLERRDAQKDQRGQRNG